MSKLLNAKIGDIITLNNKQYKLVVSDVRSKFDYDNNTKIFELHFVLIEEVEEE